MFQISETVMVSADVLYMGKTLVHFIPSGTRMNTDKYCSDLLLNMLLEMNQLSEGDFFYNEHGAKCHTR